MFFCVDCVCGCEDLGEFNVVEEEKDVEDVKGEIEVINLVDNEGFYGCCVGRWFLVLEFD